MEPPIIRWTERTYSAGDQAPKWVRKPLRETWTRTQAADIRRRRGAIETVRRLHLRPATMSKWIWRHRDRRKPTLLLSALVLLAACSSGGNGAGSSDSGLGSDAVPPPNRGLFEATFIWSAIDLDQGPDLGFEVEAIAEAEQVQPSAIALTEVGELAGLGDSSAGGNAHGVGVGFIDIDNDGFEDIFLVTGQGTDSAVYRNDRDGTFSDVTASAIGEILAGADTYSVAAADFDSDGDLDVYVTSHPRDFLLRNDGSGRFTDVTGAAGAGGPDSSQPGTASKIVSWGDYNGDGLIDLVVAGNVFPSLDTRGYLLRNRGDGSFTDVTAETQFRAAATGNPCAVLWSDFDSDGDQDLWVWNDRGDSLRNRALLRNDSGVFTDITEASGLTLVNAGNPMGIDSADVDHDGNLDYYVSNIGDHPFLHNDGDGTFRDIRDVSGTNGDYGWGLGFEDLNADSWADIFLAQEDDRPYLTFTNLGMDLPRFARAEWGHSEVGNGHNVAVAFADFDHNGTIDIVTAGTSGSRMNLFRNDTELGTARWLEVRVPMTPRTGSKGGISGRVLVKTGDLVQFRDLNGGSSRASQNASSVRFGLGQFTGADWVAILWPDGRQQVVHNVPGNRVLLMP